MGLKLVTAPVVDSDDDVVTLAEAKAHLRVDYTDEDTLIDAFRKAAIAHAEKFTGRAFREQTWDLYRDGFPSDEGEAIEIPLAPVIGIDGVFYTDSAGDEQEFTDYVADLSGASTKLSLTNGGSWPTPLEQANAVRIRFRAGYVSNDSPPVPAVPDDIKAAVLLMIGTLYQSRETVAVGVSVAQMPWSAEQLLRQHRFHLSIA